MPDLRRLRSLTTTSVSSQGAIEPVTPGELLRDEFLGPLCISQYRLAKEIGVPAQRIGQIVLGRRASPPTPTCGSAGSSDSPTAIDCGPRQPMTLTWRDETSTRSSSASSRGTWQPACSCGGGACWGLRPSPQRLRCRRFPMWNRSVTVGQRGRSLFQRRGGGFLQCG